MLGALFFGVFMYSEAFVDFVVYGYLSIFIISLVFIAWLWFEDFKSCVQVKGGENAKEKLE